MFNNRWQVRYIWHIDIIKYYPVFKGIFQRIIMRICPENIKFLKVNNMYRVILKKFFFQTCGKHTHTHIPEYLEENTKIMVISLLGGEIWGDFNFLLSVAQSMLIDMDNSRAFFKTQLIASSFKKSSCTTPLIPCVLSVPLFHRSLGCPLWHTFFIPASLSPHWFHSLHPHHSLNSL